jgi:phosphoglycerate kinase
MQASGKTVGKSLVSSGIDELAVRALLGNPKLMLPLDEVVAPAGASHDAGRVVGVNAVPATHGIYDDGPRTVAALSTLAANAKTVLWNGPLGLYEKGFTDATEALARAVGESSAYSILGGGDTVAAVEKLGLSHRFSFISTGGGAMLDFLAKGTLPGLKALEA